MTLLTMVRRAAPLIGVAPPNVVATATDPTVRLLFELAQVEGEELARYGDWKALRKEKTFTTVSGEEQTNGTLPADWAGFIDETLWNRSKRRPLYGPATPQEWQAWKSQSTFPVTDAFYYRGTAWLMNPGTAAGDTVAYEYRSSYWCQSSGGAGQDAWAADTDTGLLSERLMRLGLVWRFKQRRGLDWQTDQEDYLNEVDGELAKDQPRKVIDLKMSGPPQRIPGVVIPDGYWPVT